MYFADDGNVKLVDVEIVVQQGPKPFLGGDRHTKTGVEYHHAITQTVEGLKKDWNQYLEGKTLRHTKLLRHTPDYNNSYPLLSCVVANISNFAISKHIPISISQALM